MTMTLVAHAALVCLALVCRSEEIAEIACTNEDPASLLQSRIDVAPMRQRFERTPANPVPLPSHFLLENQMGKLIESSVYEIDEQLQLIPLLRDEDRVLQLGGNIGTSCIAAAKSQVALAANVCVEPNNANIELLKKNFQRNKVNVSILEGIVANSCEDMYLPVESHDVMPNNGWALHPVKAHQNSDKVKWQPIQCTSLEDLQAQHGNFNVILADCEGCFPSFLRENFHVLGDLEAVVWERDGDPQLEHEALEALSKLGLSCPYDYSDSKAGGMGRSTCWRTSLPTANWSTAPIFSDGPRWGESYTAWSASKV